MIAGLASNRILSLDLGRGAVRVLASDIVSDGIVAFDPPTLRLFAIHRAPDASRALIALDVRSGQRLWVAPASAFPGLLMARVLRSSFDGSAVVACPVSVDSSIGVLVLDAATGARRNFVADVTCSGAVSALPDGRFLLAGRRTPGSTLSDSLFLLDADRGAIVDAFRMSPGLQQVGSLSPLGDGSRVLVGGDATLLRYNLVFRSIEVAIQRRSPGELTVSGPAESVLLSDPGTGFDFPSSGLIREYDASLRSVRELDLRAFGTNGVPPTMGAARVTPDGAFVVLGAGTPPRGPLYGVQPARVLVLDTRTGRLVRAIDLGDWGTPLAFPY